MERFSSKDLFEKLNGCKFQNYRDLEKSVLMLFNEHLPDFPPSYSYRQLIEWGEQNRWVIPDKERGYRINVEKS